MDALLLDFNGVVVDDEPLHLLAFRAVLAEHGARIDDATYYGEYLGVDDRAAFRKALGTADVRGLVERKALRYQELARERLPVVPGVGAFVRAAANDMRIAIVSGALLREIELGLAAAGIGDVVEAVVSQEDVGTTKPDPAGFRLGLERLAGRPGGGRWRAAVVEDSLPGLAAARALGAGCLMLATTLPRRALAGADLTWDTFEGHAPRELEPLLRPLEVGP